MQKNKKKHFEYIGTACAGYFLGKEKEFERRFYLQRIFKEFTAYREEYGLREEVKVNRNLTNVANKDDLLIIIGKTYVSKERASELLSFAKTFPDDTEDKNKTINTLSKNYEKLHLFWIKAMEFYKEKFNINLQ